MMQAGKLVTFSCGRCFECVRKRKLDWVIRLHAEMSVSDVAFFSLISYNEENYPDSGVYDIHAIQTLIKSLRMRLTRNFHHMRKDVSKSIVLKYFIVSELGETLNRLHYHAVFFLSNIKEHDCTFVFWKELLENTWSKGFCSAFSLEHKTIVYTTKYIQKSYNMMLYSKGLGKNAYFDAFKDKVLSYDELDTYSINGKPHVIPRSWREELRGQQHNTIAASYVSNASLHSSGKLSLRDRIVVNNAFQSENPREADSVYVKQNNEDILPNGEF